MTIVGVMALKGGAGKTTTVGGLAWALADLGFETRVVDTDRQGSARSWLGLGVVQLDQPSPADLQERDFGGYLLIDTPPGESVALTSVLEVAETTIGVTQVGSLDLRSFQALADAVTLDLIVPTVFDGRRRVDREGLEALQARYGERVCEPVPYQVSVRDVQATQSRIPALSKAGVAYAELARRVTALGKP